MLTVHRAAGRLLRRRAPSSLAPLSTTTFGGVPTIDEAPTGATSSVPPSTARCVIIGGGVVGASCAYHLAKAGWTDTVLLEGNELTSGSTWHAAGNCPTYSSSWSMLKLQAYSTSLYRSLGARVDYPMNYHVVGAIRLAHCKERMREFEHVCSMANAQGLGFEMQTPAQLQERYPFLELHDLEGGCWDPTDGDIDPAQLTQALAKGARELGATIVRFCPVTAVRRDEAAGEWVVSTPNGEVRAEKVVNAAGYRAQEVGRMFGREIPQMTMAHQYLCSEAVPELTARLAAGTTKLPLMRDPDTSYPRSGGYYLRQDKDGFILGPYERDCQAHWMDLENDPMPADFSFQLWPDDLERLEPYIEEACARVPLLGTAGITRVVNGPIPYTPDGNPLVGPMPGVPGAYEACVFSFGITQAGGAGKVLAEWVTEGETEWDMWSVDPRRFTSFADQAYTNAKGVEVYSHEYDIQFPRYEWPAGRGKRVSPLYERLASRGAQFTAHAGWERAAWFARPGDDTSLDACKTFDRRGPWYEAVREECLAVRDAAGLLELPGFSRFRLAGDGAAAALRALVTGTLPRTGRMSLVYVSDTQGRIVSELSAVRLGKDEFLLTSGSGAEWHDEELLRAHLAKVAADSGGGGGGDGGGGIALTNETEGYTALVLSGPRSADIMAEVSPAADLALPWLSHQRTTVAGCDVAALRVSYAGELGWELHVRMGDAAAVHDAVTAAGARHGLRPFGTYALDSLRIEKGYRSWKQDLSTDYTMLEGGLARFVKLDKAQPFPGREALRRQRDAGGPAQTFATLTVRSPDCDAPYLATVWAGDERVGLVTSGNYGHRTEQSIALAVVDAASAAEGTALEVEIFGERFPAVVQAEGPLYDNDNRKLRGVDS